MASSIGWRIREIADLITSKQTAGAGFTAALDELIEQVKEDRSILAAILCGSLSYDVVWHKSDIDLALVTIDDRKIEQSNLSLNAGGVNVHALLFPRSEFRKMVQASIRNSFVHSFLAKGRLIYTHDPTIEQLCAELQELGERDTQIQLLAGATQALPLLYKAHKFFITRRDLDYTALWLLYAATAFARIEVIGARMLADREVVLQALKLNPEFFKTIYSDLLNTRKTIKTVQSALDAADEYVLSRAGSLFRPVIDYLQDVGEARSSTEIDDHFQRNLGVHGVTTACEYMADQGLIGKVSTPRQLTKRSNVMVQELAFVYLGDNPR